MKLSATSIPGEDPQRRGQPSRHSELLTYRLHFVAKAAGSRVSRLCRDTFQVSRRQLRLLSMLHERAPQSPSDLAAITGLDRARVSRELDELEQRGYVERRSVAGDARRQWIRLTPAGEQLHRALVGMIREVNESLLEALSDAQRRALLDSLSALEARLGLHRGDADLPG